MNVRYVLEARGIVQGVGFRPFVAREALSLGLAGTVSNTAYGARVVCEGEEEACRTLARHIREASPPGAVLFSLDVAQENPLGETGFRILTSESGAPEAAVSPDLGVCPDCARELFDPTDRRYRYPFLNCTNCGPRFTILECVPYDRANTSMARFAMCPACEGEYLDPANRRFHAQPNACAVCGPRLCWLEDGEACAGDPIARFQQAIAQGRLVAVRGVGGFHLACDATNASAVSLVRERKRRYEKPLAVMARDLAAAESLCEVSAQEKSELLSPRKPIVLLKKRPDCAAAGNVAPGSGRLGVMLPYTPLHLLLCRDCPPLVLTSANVSDAPMPYREEQIPRLWPLADAVLTHDRPILRRMDDSVCVFAAGSRRLMRRARGFAPEPVPLRVKGADTAMQALAFGAQLKNTFCLLKEGRAYLSGHMGDLDDAEVNAFCRAEIPAFLALFGGEPRVLAHDLHPDYASTRMARSYAKEHPGTALFGVQHHHAHLASVLAEHGLARAVGFVFDGAGYGSDGESWGGELLYGSAAEAKRLGRLRPLRLPGGDASIRAPWKIGLAAVFEACGEEAARARFGAYPEAEAVLRLTRRGMAAHSSGMGRLFDAVAAIAGLGKTVSYEGQAAIALEQAFDAAAAGRYAFEVAADEAGMLVFDWRELISAALRDAAAGAGAGVISARFHRAVAALVTELSGRFSGEAVALSGGVFQNVRLLEDCFARLGARGVSVYANERVPANDGGISFGQAAVAAAKYGG